MKDFLLPDGRFENGSLASGAGWNLTKQIYAKCSRLLLFVVWMAMFWRATVYGQISVLTYHNDNSRSGLNANETVLTPSNVNKNQFGKLFSVPVDGKVHAQPLYVANVDVPSFASRNVIYVATEHDSVYAIDADAGVIFWKVSFINPSANVTTVSSTTDLACSDISPEMGITGTPVIDSSTGTLYVVALTKESGIFVQRLHALDIATGAEKFGGPIVVQAAVPGTGLASVNGTVEFNPLYENQRAGLLLSSGVIYIGYGSHCDLPPYHGWLLAYDAATLEQIGAFNSTANGGKGGIWQAGGGIAADATGVLYFVSGNGTFDANTGGTDYANSYFKLQLMPPFTVEDYFTPYNEASLNAGNDQEPGSGGVILLPDQAGSHPRLMIGSGKQGIIYLLDRDKMGEFNPTTNLVVQQISGQIGSLFSTPATWQNNVYFGPASDCLKVFTLRNGVLSSTPASHAPKCFAWPGATPSISANGTTNALVWALQTDAFSTNGPAVLHAYDATNLATEFYNSNQNLARDDPGAAVKFSVPTIANGKVYVGAQQQVSVYGLLQPFPGGGGPTSFNIIASPSSATIVAGQSANYRITITPSGGPFNKVVALTCSQVPATVACAFSPPNVIPGYSSVTSSLTITTATAFSSGLSISTAGTRGTWPSWTTLLLPLGALCIYTVLLLIRGDRRKLFNTAATVITCGVVTLQICCGGGSSTPLSTPVSNPTSLSITVTASSGSQQASTMVSLVVQ